MVGRSTNARGGMIGGEASHQEVVMAYPDAAGSQAGYAAYARTLDPTIRQIGMADIGAALRAGWEDFLARPSFAVFLALIYPIVGLFLLLYTVGYDFFPLLFPLA